MLEDVAYQVAKQIFSDILSTFTFRVRRGISDLYIYVTPYTTSFFYKSTIPKSS